MVATAEDYRRLRVFLCHASEDKEQVNILYKQLEALGFDPWLDKKKLLPGQEWEPVIEKEISNTDAVIVCLSSISVKKKGYIQRELRIAQRRADYFSSEDCFFIPVRLNECEVPFQIQQRFNYVDWFDATGFNKLIEALNSRASKVGLKEVVYNGNGKLSAEVIINKETVVRSQANTNVDICRKKDLAILDRINNESDCKEIVIDGMVIEFGMYKWRVLCTVENAALLITEDITDIGIPYNSNYEDVSWKTSSLRIWLNTQFYGRFNQSEKKRIIKKNVLAENNPWYGTDAGEPTDDYVFLLSISEVVNTFGNSGSLYERPENEWVNEMATGRQSCAIDDRFNTERCATYKGEKTWWWLRSPGVTKSTASYVNTNGIIFLNGESAFDDGGTSCVGIRPGIRPALWLLL